VGDFTRALHYWLASLFALLVVAHLVRVFVTGSFKAPREFTWISGVIMAGLVGAALFTGMALKGDQQAVDAAARRTDFVDLFGGLGFWFSADFTDSVEQVVRVHIAHVTVVPMLIVALLAGHILLIKRHGISPMPTGDPDAIELRRKLTGQIEFLSHQQHLARLGVPLFAAVLLLSAVAAPDVGALGDRALEPQTKPPWYFLWLYQIDELLGRTGVVLAVLAMLFIQLVLPFVERSDERDPRRRPRAMAFGGALAGSWFALTLAGALA
jgi:quinol-cytochrome oxidoreductase complex cytochrome b subunit